MSKVNRPQSWHDFQELIKDNLIVVADFSRKHGCVWCDRLHPIFERVAEHSKSDVVYAEIHLDELLGEDLMEFMNAYKIAGTPTVVLFKNGEYERDIKERTYFKMKVEIENEQ